MKYFLNLIIITLVLAPINARADTSISFQKASKYKELNALSLVQNSTKTGVKYLISSTDLNDDFIDEYIVKPDVCSIQRLCPFFIIAYMDKKPVEIGRFSAHKILISQTKDYGIRRLKLYNQANNDFSSQEAKWDPYEFKYVYK